MTARYKFPQVTSLYGSPMGRRHHLPENVTAPRKLQLQFMRLVDGDYDNGGAYWGSGNMPLYVAFDSETEIVIRAANRQEAKSAIREIIPGARFYN